MSNWSTKPGVRISGKRTLGKPTGIPCPTCEYEKVWVSQKGAIQNAVPRCPPCQYRKRYEKLLNDGVIDEIPLPANYPTTEAVLWQPTGTDCRTCNEPMVWIKRTDLPDGLGPRCLTCKAETCRKYYTSKHGQLVMHKAHKKRWRRKEFRETHWERQKIYRETPEGKRTVKKAASTYRALRHEQLCHCCEGSNYWESVEDIYPGARCYCCGGKPDAFDHIIALACCRLFPGRKHPMFPSGLHCNKNLAPICNSCNSSKGSRIFPDLPEWEDWIHERHLWRRRQLYSERNN